jgi:predicted metal-dependent peptidase
MAAKMCKGEKVFLNAKSILMNDHWFFSTLCFNLRTVPTRDVQTMATDGQRLLVNYDWVGTLTPKEAVFVIAHEGLHCAFHHPARMGKRNHRRWNEACDYAINLQLVKSNLKMPDTGLYDSKWEGMTAEQIYDKLIKEDGDGQGGAGQPGDGSPSPGSNGSSQADTSTQAGDKPAIGEGDVGGCGEILPAPDQSSSGLAEMEREWKVVTAQAIAIAKRMGKCPGHIAQELGELNESKVDWKEYLIRFVQERCWDDYSWQRPNRNYLQQGLYAPSIYDKKIKKVLFARDTSGSMWNEMNMITSEMRGIMEAVKCEVVCVDCDTRVTQVLPIEDVDDLKKAHPKGGGGTDFRPLFQWIVENEQEQDISCIIFATDTCGTLPDDSMMPEADVLWLCTDNKGFTPPFGDAMWL